MPATEPPPTAYAGAMTAATSTTPAKLAALCDALRGQVVAGIRELLRCSGARAGCRPRRTRHAPSIA